MLLFLLYECLTVRCACRNKAVAEGAVSYYLGNVVSARVARLTYGVQVVCAYNESNAEHYSRRDKLVQWPSGRMMVPKGFSSILTKV